MVDRIDHFAHLRDPVQSEPPADAPVVTPDLIAWLERQFPERPFIDVATSMDDLVGLASVVAVGIGHRQVIVHLKSLMQKA